jgi:hypothetical protein
MTETEVNELIKKMEDSKPNKCWLSHKWSIWSEPYDHKLDWVDKDSKKTSIADWVIKQKRFCVKCRKVEIRVKSF